MREAVDAFVEGHRARLLQLCADLVAAPSVNPPGDTRAPAAVLCAFFAEQGIPVEIAAAVPAKPNLVVALEGNGPGPHLAFNGHLDTIPPGDESAWSVPLFQLTRRGDRLYGLGIGNMKGGVAALALATAFLHARRADWLGRVTLTLVADETVFGPDGAGWLLDHRPELLGDALICAEGPGEMGLAIAEKGLLWIEIEATAPPGQGMLSRRGSGAVARLAAVLHALDALNDVRAEPPGEISILADNAGEHGLRLSVNCGTIEGGHFVSQVATRAVARVDFRIPPGLALAEVEGCVDAIVRTHPAVTWRRIKGWEANWTAPHHAICRASHRVGAFLHAGARKNVVRLPASDAARWRARGVPAVCFGPQPTFAAGVDDYVLEADVIACAKFYALAALEYLAGANG